jgi:putative transposase
MQDSQALLRWFYVALHLLIEAGAARRDARIRFLKAQVEILRRKLGGNRVIPSPDDRARLLAIGQELDHNVADVIGIVTPQTYCRWVMELREGRRPKRVGRPRIARNLREFVVHLAKENAGWGYRRIIGELRKLRLRIGRSSVRRILKDEGLTPSPMRRGRAAETTWRKFIRLHVNTLVACDFFTKSVITPLGVQLAYSLAFIHLGTRKVFLSPPTYHPHEHWVQQQGRNLLMWLEDQQLEARFLIHDRDRKFSAAFRNLFRNAGTRCLRTPFLAPDANAFCEAWIGALKRKSLDHFPCFSLCHLDYIAQQFVRFHNSFRPQQGLGNWTLPAAAAGPPEQLAISHAPQLGRVRCRRFLGGLLRTYPITGLIPGRDRPGGRSPRVLG